MKINTVLFVLKSTCISRYENKNIIGEYKQKQFKSINNQKNEFLSKSKEQTRTNPQQGRGKTQIAQRKSNKESKINQETIKSSHFETNASECKTDNKNDSDIPQLSVSYSNDVCQVP